MVGSSACRKMLNASPVWGEKAHLTMAQQMEASTELGLVDGESIFKIVNSLTLLQKLFFLTVNIFCRSH